MEHGELAPRRILGNPTDPLGMDNVPLMGTFNFDAFQTRVGELLDDEGMRIGVIVEWWFIPLPWFRFRMNFETLHIVTFIEKLQAVLSNEEE